MKHRLLIAEPIDFSPRALSMLRAALEVDLAPVGKEGLAAALRDYDAVWFRLAHRIDSRVLGPATRCRVIATPVTGIDHIDLAACAAAGIRVVSLKGEVEFLKEVRATAELTVGLTLALLRRIPAAAASVREGRWQRDLFRGRELYGKTLGLVGVGRLGSLVAQTFAAFGMRVVGHDPRPDLPDGVLRADSLHALLRESDIVSVHVSYDASTHNLIDAAAVAEMKAGAWFVNTSRGGVVDETALLAALSSGRLAGAALDVLSSEPDIDAGHPVVRYAQSHDNLLIVPHIGGNTVESFEKTEIFLATKVLEALR